MSPAKPADPQQAPPHRALLHTERIPIRWGDMDAMRHVNNTIYFRYMEQARITWIDGMRESLQAEGAGTVVASTGCNFRKPLTYPGTVEVRVYSGRVGGSSVTTLYELRMAGEEAIYADGEAIVVWINMASGKAVRVPLAIRERLGKAAA
jgi:acyl-CoA thioester hydrolase